MIAIKIEMRIKFLFAFSVANEFKKQYILVPV